MNKFQNVKQKEIKYKVKLCEPKIKYKTLNSGQIL